MLPSLALHSSSTPYSFVYQSTDIKYSNIKIHSVSANSSAPAANSDGWDIYRSSYVTISDSNVQNDDDWWVPYHL